MQFRSTPGLGALVVSFTCTAVLDAIVSAGGTGRLAAVAVGFATMLMNRWSEKVGFNRFDVHEEDVQRMDAIREEAKLQAALLAGDKDGRKGSDEELIREMRKIGVKPVFREVGTGDRDPVPLPTREVEEDAKAMFWS
jgi:hypothetical protein